MKKGDLVISLGDVWVDAGSKGIVRSVKNRDGENGSALVSWESSPHYRHPRTLFHKQKALTVDSNWQKNPNAAFKRRKEL